MQLYTPALQANAHEALVHIWDGKSVVESQLLSFENGRLQARIADVRVLSPMGLKKHREHFHTDADELARCEFATAHWAAQGLTLP